MGSFRIVAQNKYIRSKEIRAKIDRPLKMQVNLNDLVSITIANHQILYYTTNTIANITTKTVITTNNNDKKERSKE